MWDILLWCPKIKDATTILRHLCAAARSENLSVASQCNICTTARMLFDNFIGYYANVNYWLKLLLHTCRILSKFR